MNESRVDYKAYREYYRPLTTYTVTTATGVLQTKFRGELSPYRTTASLATRWDGEISAIKAEMLSLLRTLGPAEDANMITERKKIGEFCEEEESEEESAEDEPDDV